MRRLSKWWTLPAWERKAYLSLMFLLPVVWIGLRARGFSRMRQWAEQVPAPREATWFPALSRPEVIEAVQRCGSLTVVAARHGLYRANCLHQALALCRLLRGQRIPAELKLGVRKDQGVFDAHAWLELDGQVIGEQVPGYVAFDGLETTQKMTG